MSFMVIAGAALIGGVGDLARNWIYYTESFQKVSAQVMGGKPFNQIIEIGGQRIRYTAFNFLMAALI